MDSPITLDVNNLPHVKLINEDNIDIKTLPKSIRTNINMIIGQIKRFQGKPTQRIKDHIVRYSIKVADSIQDHIENDIQDSKEPNPNQDMKDDKPVTDPATEPIAEPIASTPAEPATPDEPVTPKKEIIKGDSGKANKIYSELEELLKQNKISVSLEELKTLAPISYSVIFDTYKDGEENGIEIGDIQLKETENQKFTITK